MIILRHNNTLQSDDLFIIETTMLKISENPYQYALDYSLLNKPKSEIYGFIAGIFTRMNICQTLGITISEFVDFLIDIERGYLGNPYHSFYHAVDITMVLYYMLEQYDMSEYLNPTDLALLMIAALCHDIGHPGKNNSFEVCCKSEIAKQFHGLSVLESQSCILTLELLDKHNLFRHFESKQDMKISIVKMILATDMVCHFTLQENISTLHEIIRNHHSESVRLQKKFKSIVSIDRPQLKPLWDKEPTPFSYFKQKYFMSTADTLLLNHAPAFVLNDQERLMMCKIIIHAADISNPCRPWSVFHQLSRLVCIEFFRQGEAEHQLGLPISPNMDPNRANPSSINIGFIDFVVQPYFETLSQLFPKCQPLLVNCTKNRGEWLKLSTVNTHSILSPIEKKIPSQHVTLAAGTVDIPDKYMKERTEKVVGGRKRLNRSVSYQEETLPSSNNFLSPTEHGNNDDTVRVYSRRKSEDVSIIRRKIFKNATTTAPRSSPIGNGGRRKSEESSIYVNQLKMVSLFD